MKKLSLLAILISLFLFVSCQDKYVMPYTPGVTVDEEAFYEHKTLWENCGIKNYSYTYSYKNSSYPCDNCVIDVVIENDVVTEYVIKSYMEKSSSEMTEEKWAEWVHNLQSRLEESTDFLRIDAIYDYIERNIKEYNENYNKNPDCFYAKATFEFIKEVPFILCYNTTFLTMKPYLGGNGSTIEIKIENFKEN